MVIFNNRVVIQEFLSASYSVDSLWAFLKPSVVVYLFISIIYVTGIILFNYFNGQSIKVTYCFWINNSAFHCRVMRTMVCLMLRWVHTCNITAYCNTLSWQCGRDSWLRNVSKVGYAVALRACSVCCRYLVVASKGWYGYGLSRCGRATSCCTSTPAQAVTISSLWCDGQILTAHRTSP